MAMDQDDQMKAEFSKAAEGDVDILCNGVGPQYGGLLCRFIPLRALFDSAADEHDWDYWCGGGKEAYLRANLRFLGNCLLSVANHSPLLKIPGHAFMAFVYFALVKWFGRLSFKWRPISLSQEQMHALAMEMLEKRTVEDLEKEK
jgi:hypothetical protein